MVMNFGVGRFVRWMCSCLGICFRGCEDDKNDKVFGDVFEFMFCKSGYENVNFGKDFMLCCFYM